MASESGEAPLSPRAGEAHHGADPVHAGQSKQQLHRFSPAVLLRSSTHYVMFEKSLSHSEPCLLCETEIVIVPASQEALVVKKPPASAGGIRDLGSIPGSGRSPGEGNGNPLQYSCLENLMDRGAWW